MQKEKSKFWTYQLALLKDFETKTGVSYKDKVVLEIGSDFEHNVARYFVEKGAKEVICVNPLFSDDMISPNPKIKLIKQKGEQTNMPSNHFDIIFGIALMEHVLEPKSLFLEVKRMLKLDGIAYLQGCPLYPSSAGHHIWVNCTNKHYYFNDKTNPFEPWEHLTLKTKEEIEKNLKSKNIPQEDIEKILIFLQSNDISGYSASRLIKEAKSVPNICYTTHETVEPNLFYEIARKKYSEKDLKTIGITFIIQKNKLTKANLKLQIFLKKLMMFLRILFT